MYCKETTITFAFQTYYNTCNNNKIMQKHTIFPYINQYIYFSTKSMRIKLVPQFIEKSLCNSTFHIFEFTLNLIKIMLVLRLINECAIHY